MTTEREMLEFAAKACGIDGVWQDEFGMHLMGKYLLCPGELPRYWNPITNSADCAAMCAKLGIDTYWGHTKWQVVSVECGVKQILELQLLKDHNNDREAAWRYAATQVAAKIGGMK